MAWLDDFLLENAPGERENQKRLARLKILRQGPGAAPEIPIPEVDVPATGGYFEMMRGEPPAYTGGASGSWDAPAKPPGRPQALPNALARTQGVPGGQNAPVAPAGAPGGAAVGPPAPAIDPGDAEIARLRQQQKEAQDAQDALLVPPDRTASEEAYRKRAAAGGKHMALALLANEAKLEPFSAQHLKQAAEARAPMKMAGGTMTDEGFIEDPAYQQELKLRRADGRLKQIDQALQNALTAQDRKMLEREKIKAQMDLKREQIEAQKAIAAIVHGGKGGKGGEGGEYDALPKAATNEEKKAYAAAVAGRTALPQLMKEVDANPDAFGMGVGLGEKAGGLIGAGNPVPMTAQQQATRARIYSRYSAIINEMIGAAQSPAEYARLQAFIPGQLESAEGIKRKMEGALQEFNATHGLLRQRYAMGEGPVYMEPGATRGGGGGGGGLPQGWSVTVSK